MRESNSIYQLIYSVIIKTIESDLTSVIVNFSGLREINKIMIFLRVNKLANTPKGSKWKTFCSFFEPHRISKHETFQRLFSSLICLSSRSTCYALLLFRPRNKCFHEFTFFEKVFSSYIFWHLTFNSVKGHGNVIQVLTAMVMPYILFTKYGLKISMK